MPIKKAANAIPDSKAIKLPVRFVIDSSPKKNKVIPRKQAMIVSTFINALVFAINQKIIKPLKQVFLSSAIA